MDAHSDQAEHQAETGHSAGGAYVRFAGMMVLSFVAMYILMYAMVDKVADVYLNGNQAYMAALMTAPMAIFELLLMGSMYRNRAVNAAILVGACVVLVVAWLAIRNQTAIDDKQFVKSMIPHHSGAILMCEGASLADAELKQLCADITVGQQAEIDQMRAILERTEKARL